MITVNGYKVNPYQAIKSRIIIINSTIKVMLSNFLTLVQEFSQVGQAHSLSK